MVTSSTQGVAPDSPWPVLSACTTDPNCSGAHIPGSPKSINVTYTVGAIPAPVAALAPSVATAGVAGSHGKSGLHENSNVPSFDRAGTRMAVPEQTATGVLMFDMGFERRGALPSTTVAYAVGPDAQRAYTMTVDSGARNVRAFNLGGATAGTVTVLPELTTAVLPLRSPVRAKVRCPTSAR